MEMVIDGQIKRRSDEGRRTKVIEDSKNMHTKTLGGISKNHLGWFEGTSSSIELKETKMKIVRTVKIFIVSPWNDEKLAFFLSL